MSIQETLPEFDGVTAYGGALRFFDPSSTDWKKEWGVSYGTLMPNMRIFASDAFGVMYGLDENDLVVVFWSEMAEVERLGIGQEDFYSLIRQDPEGTISYSLFLEACKALGDLSLDKHLAFVIELSLGGKLSVENIIIMDAVEHMKMLGKMANIINRMPIGKKFNKVAIER